jgi:putative serine protease PepD
VNSRTGAGAGHPWRVITPIALLAALVGGVVGGIIVDQVGPSSSSTANGSSCPATNVANQVLPSVVTISASGGPTGSAAGSAPSTGSGEVINSSGYILTNNHVISVAANGGAVRVLFNNTNAVPATIVGRDPLTDLAVLRVQGEKSVKPIAIGSSTDLKVGQGVMALGAPLGLSSTVTTGVVSALGRTVQVPGENDSRALLVDAIQTDAAINPGNSGGALVDCGGKLIGVPTAGASVPSPAGQPSSGGNIGLGFAIPVNLANTVANEIISTGRVTHAFFGLQTTPVTTQAGGAATGLYIVAVVAGGPAQAAGLNAGDIITEVDNTPATSTDTLAAITLTKRPGDKVSVKYVRQGRSATTTVTLGAQP